MNTQRDGAMAEQWQRTLSAIPTVIGRLAYLSSLRNVNTGSYEHFGLAQRLGESDADALLRRSHMSAFQEWLGFPLERQRAELEEYFSGLREAREDIVSTWLMLKPWTTWVPPGSRDVERDLFNDDLGVVLERFRVEYGVASRDPDS